jgi:hypothetical protein
MCEKRFVFCFTVIGAMTLDNSIFNVLYIPDIRRTLKYKDKSIDRATRYALELSLLH